VGEQARIWVFHAGALGDHVMIWPLLRAMVRSGADVTLVCDAGKGRLAVAEIGVRWEQAELPRYTRLWTGEYDGEPERGVGRVLTFVADPATEGGCRWAVGAAAMFPGAALEFIGPPGSASRQRAWREARVEELGAVAARETASGPVVVHVGAGSRAKMWPMACWEALAADLRSRGLEVAAIAGEVEAERLDAAERAALARLGGRFVETLEDLAAVIRGARLFIGADTGPTHLAAQLGVPTLALFGPTDPTLWSPRGPAVRVLAPQRPAEMKWLAPATAASAAGAMLKNRAGPEAGVRNGSLPTPGRW